MEFSYDFLNEISRFLNKLTFDWLPTLCTAKVGQALIPASNLIFYHSNCDERVLKSQHIYFIFALIAAWSQLNF